MALVFADAAGTVLRVLIYPMDIERFGRTMPGATQIVEFDEIENPMLAKTLPDKIKEFTIDGGVLKFQGNVVPINQDRPMRKALKFLRTVRQKLSDGTATQQERDMALAAAVQCVIHTLMNE